MAFEISRRHWEVAQILGVPLNDSLPIVWVVLFSDPDCMLMFFCSICCDSGRWLEEWEDLFHLIHGCAHGKGRGEVVDELVNVVQEGFGGCKFD